MRFIPPGHVRATCICAFRSLPEAEKRPAGTFSHVSADASGPREALRLADRFLIADELWFMPSGQGTSGRGLRPEMVPPGAPRIAGGNEFTKAKPLFPFEKNKEVPTAFQADNSKKFRLLTSSQPEQIPPAFKADEKNRKGTAFVSLG